MQDTVIMLWGYCIAVVLWLIDMTLVTIFNIDTKYSLSIASLVFAILTLGFTIGSLLTII